MTIQVRRYEHGDLEAVEALNRRLEAAGVTDRVWPEAHAQPSEAKGDPLNQEMYVAVDDANVRGGVWLHEHDFFVDGRCVRAGWLKYPVSESIIDRRYGGVPAALIMALMRRQPRLMALGMGSRKSPLARLLQAFKWEVTDIPFYITPVRSGRVLSGIPALTNRRGLRTVMSFVGHSGLASVLGAPLNWARRARTRLALRGAVARPVPTFGEWTDTVWEENVASYGLTARRDRDMLDHMYSDTDDWLTRIRVTRGGQDIGWACTALADLTDRAPHPAFGQLRVGLLADAFGSPDDALAIMGLGMRHLEHAGADVVFSNQIHEKWSSALHSLGFVRWTSNFLFACSPAMSTSLGGGLADRSVLLNRGDCDGPRWW